MTYNQYKRFIQHLSVYLLKVNQRNINNRGLLPVSLFSLQTKMRDFRVNFDKSVYEPGNTVTGQVFLNLPSTLKIKGNFIFVLYVGRSRQFSNLKSIHSA